MKGRTFKSRRKHLEMSIVDIAKRLDVSRHTVWMWETDQSPVPTPVALLLEMWCKHGY